MNTITVTLPLPPIALAPNSRAGWHAKANATKRYRLDAGIAAQVAARELDDWSWMPLSRASIQVVYYSRTVRFLDRDNILAALKAAFDGLCDAGVLTDDRDVDYPSAIREKDAHNPRVELIISEVSDGN